MNTLVLNYGESISTPKLRKSEALPKTLDQSLYITHRKNNIHNNNPDNNTKCNTKQKKTKPKTSLRILESITEEDMTRIINILFSKIYCYRQKVICIIETKLLPAI